MEIAANCQLIVILVFGLVLQVQCVVLRSEKHSLQNFKPSMKTSNTILIGVLVPIEGYNRYSSGSYYASSMFVAIDDINNNTNLLPHHDLQLVWADTKCNSSRTLKLLEDLKKVGVDAIIGGGCADCQMTAKYAQENNIPLLSHECEALNLASRYNTFVGTSLKFHHLYVEALAAILEAFQWKKFGVVIENTTLYNETMKDVMNVLGESNITSIAFVESTWKYTYSESFPALKQQIQRLKENSRIIVILASARIMKEVMVAAEELQMTDGRFVLITALLDFDIANIYLKKPFKFITTDYSPGLSLSDNYFDRSIALCHAFKSTLLISFNTEVFYHGDREKFSAFQDKVRSGMLKWFGMDMYSGKIPGTNYSKAITRPPISAVQLYDAIKNYAKAANYLMVDGKDYSDGAAVQKYFHYRTENSISGYIYRYGMGGQLLHPLHLYQRGYTDKQGGREGLEKCINKNFTALGDFQTLIGKNSFKLIYKRISGVQVSWPTEGGLEGVVDQPPLKKKTTDLPSKKKKEADHPPSKKKEADQPPSKKKGKKKSSNNMVIIIVCVVLGLIILLVGFILLRVLKKRRDRYSKTVNDDGMCLADEEQL